MRTPENELGAPETGDARARISTPDEIAAWLDLRDDFTDLSYPPWNTPAAQERMRWERAALRRLCPEVTDYIALMGRMKAEYGIVRVPSVEALTREQVERTVMEAVAKLWAPALSVARAFTESDEVPS